MKPLMNTDRRESEQDYGRDNGAELGPMGLLMLGLIFLVLCPGIMWRAVKRVALLILPRRNAKNAKRASANRVN